MPPYNNTSKNSYEKNDSDTRACIEVVISFLQVFIPETTARKLICVILIAAGMSVSRISELAGLSDRSVQSAGRAIRDGSIGNVLAHKKASGRKRKTTNVEDQIIAESVLST